MGKRSKIEKNIFDLSDKLAIPVDALINELKFTPEIYREIILMRLHPIDDPRATALYSYDLVALKFNRTRLRVRQLIEQAWDDLNKKYG